MYPAAVPSSEPSMVELTPKERLVHDLLVFEGLTDGEMAERLGMSERAIKFHVQNLLQKTQAPDRFKMAVAFWREWSGYDEQVPDAPRPVRKRTDMPFGSRRAKPAKKKFVGKKKARAPQKIASKKKGAAEKKVAPKTSASRKKAVSLAKASKSRRRKTSARRSPRSRG
ncbi:MAG: LuxR C-terminal-related transcriptional regulator [Myxococcales bacterium]|nr:LuxR C-terminal-related transcriptional regulator [Myxococcales bacterium]